MQSLILSFWCVLSSAVFILGAVEYSNRWTVQIDGGINEADRLAQKHGFVNQGKIMDNYYSFEHHQVEKISHAGSAHLHKGLMSEANVKMVEQQELKSYDLLSSQSMDFHATDTRFEDMWYINRDDQPSYNVIDVWKRNITGEGVVVAVVDDGLEAEHPEIQGNYDQAASFDVVDNDTYPLPKNKLTQEYGHGTKCAGVIAAVLNNSNCGVGLAYKAHLGGIRLFENKRSTDADEARALSYAANHIHIYSNSWGPSDKGFRVAGPGYFTQNALKNGAEKGRRGLGSIYVFGAGNGGLLARDSCAFNGYVNSIYTIAISGIKSDGSIPIFGENCPGLMAVTYSRDVLGDSSKVITSGAKKSCTDTFTASSAAAAMASGLIALMMSANPELSWRDIQHIIVRTARPDPVGISGGDWSKNKAGLRMNDYVGFGLMDARGMVDAAINWTTVPPKVNCTIPRLGVNSRIPSRETLEETIDLSNWKDFCRDKINYLEHVEVSVNLNYSRRGDLLIKLISPQQTVSNLTHYRLADSEYGETDLNWVLMSLHHWGENATGVWKLRLHNSQLDRNNTGILFNWTLILHGTTLNPLDDNSHVNTTATPPPIKKPTNRTTTPQSKGYPSIGIVSLTEAFSLKTTQHTLTWGEALPVKLSKAWKEVCFMVDLLIASEYWLALYSHCDVFRDPLDGREKHLLMPLPKLQIHLLSADGDLGDEGEMILRGDTVSPGYIGSDGRICNDEGSEFFLKGLRYLRTRDKLRRVEGGCLVYCGRSGSLAKRGGQFVDLEDLAEQLQAIPGMASCALLQGERLEAFVTLEPEEVLSRLPHPVNSALNDAQKLLGPTARLHLRSRLPRHPVTGKVQRNQLEEQVSASVQRELQHLQLRTRIQWQMLRSYCSWYPVILLQVTLATLLGHLARAPATWDLLWTGPLRLLLLPYLWAALAYTPLLPLPTKRRTRAFYEGLSISPPEMLMLVTGLVPWNWICTLQVLACALLVFYRRDKAQHALPFLGFALVMPWLPFLAQLALCAGCVLLDVLLPHDDRYVLPSLPLCFYLVMPKWFSDEVRWYLKRNRLRKLLYFWLLPKPPWDSSWFWEDRDRSFTILNGCGTVRVAKANHGLSLTVEFAETVPVLSRSGRSGPAVRPSALEESPLAGLVRRAGGDPSGGLRLDSLQGTVLAEMIRKELRRSISVADVLRSKDLLELQEKLQSCDCTKMEPEKEDSAVSPSSIYRLWMLQFPRHPVDWCLRYEAGRHLDVPAMQRAVDRLVARHSALRTSETPDEPLREIMDKAAAMWQLWRSCCGSSCYWRYVRGPTASALFALWPRTVVHASGHVEVKVPELEDGRVRRERWDWASHDQYIGGLLDDLLRPRRWPFEVAVTPLFYGQATGRNAIEAALAKPPSEVAWYIYCSITHAYSDGLCGQALFADLLRFYEEELHGTLTPLEPAPEPLALLQRRLWRSFNRDAAEQPEPNEDLYHESICDDWGKRSGMSRRIYFHANVTRTLRLAASNVFGCSTDLAWLTVIMCAMFRLFPQQQRMMLILKASCRDGPGEGQMVAFLSEARVFALDTGDPSSATILEVHQQIQRVRLSRDWRAPEPFEFGLCVYVNIVSAMVNSLPSGYRHVVRETSPPSYWDSVAYSHLNLRIDQLRMDEWDFRIFHHDSAWGWDWPTSFAYHLGEVIRRMAMDPLSPLMEVEAVRTNPGTNGSGPGQARMACEDSPAAPRQKRSKEDAASGENGPPAKSLRLSKDPGHGH